MNERNVESKRGYKKKEDERRRNAEDRRAKAREEEESNKNLINYISTTLLYCVVNNMYCSVILTPMSG